jgi:putative ABC transport system permease protein
VAVATLGLGIGANTAIFSVVNGVVLEPLAYPDSDELVSISSAFPTMGFETFWVSPPEYLELQERSRSLEVVGAYRSSQASLGGGERPERVQGAVATAQLIEALGVEARMGRTFGREDDLPGAEPVVLLSYESWQRTFGGDADIVGRGVDVDGVRSTVVGVMPPGFDLNDEGIEVWQPLGLDLADPGSRASHFLHLVGRLRDGVDVAAAERELADLVAGWEEANPGDGHVPNPEFHPMSLTPLHDQVVGEVRTALFVLLGAVGFVLLIACANVANLLLARAEARQKEVAVRVAMGAGRGRLLRQFLTEGVVLALVGGVLGVAMAWASLELLRAVGPGELPRLGEVRLDGTVLWFTAGIAVFTGVLFGLAPARYLSGSAMAGTLRDGGTRTTAGGGRVRLRSLLVVSEVALALILTLGSGLLIRSFSELTAVDPGFDADGVLTFQLYLPATAYPDPADGPAFHDRLRERLAALPGVISVAAMSGLPPMRDLNANDTEFEGLERREEGPAHNVDYYQTVHGPYLEAMDIDVVAGRGFTAADRAGSLPVALVNETLARVFYGDASPVGRLIRPCCGGDVWFEIVGVVEDVKQGGLDAPTGTELYVVAEQSAEIYGFANRSMNVVLRTSVRPETVTAQVRRTVAELDPTLPLAGLRTMDEVLAGARARPRFLTTLLGAFAGVALLLAAVGTYGVMSYAVAQRAREMGIRMALGAEASTVRALVLRRGVAVALVGLVAGLAGAWWLTGLLESLLFGVAARDPMTFAAVPLLLLAVAVAASWIPAHRATRVNPVEVLRED